MASALNSALQAFSPPTRQWFEAVFAAPTPAQEGAWESISSRQHTLVVAPTGSGKTLAAFLWAIDRLGTSKDSDQHGTKILYVSPLKALAVDVERNLRAPLAGIRNAYERAGQQPPEVTVSIRSGDTPSNERQRQLRRPSDILITTPESLFLMLTSRARDTLRAVSTVIVDEVHAVAGTKRGSHLALSLERLDELLPSPAQRIGLSATVRPTDAVASFLGGNQPVNIVQPPSHKELDLSVIVPVEDLGALGSESIGSESAGGDFGGGDLDFAGELAPVAAPSIWPHVEAEIVDLVAAHKSTIVFANSRRLTERLAARLNEEAARRAGKQVADAADAGATAGPPAQVMAQAGATLPLPPGGEIARAHHGSVSREQRAQIEDELKRGLLPAVVATSSLELGIDMGAVDLVIQVEPPPSVASGLQRIGRAGHQVDEVSRGVLFPKHRGDLIPTCVAVERMRSGDIEQLAIPRNPLDVLAQQIVAMVSMDDWTVEALGALVRRADPFRALPDSALETVLDMLSGRYPSDAFAELKPRLVWDRDAGTLVARPGAHRVAVINGGTIPDRGLYGVFLASGDGPGRRVGELDEEMVYESRIGDVFALGSTSWQIIDITHDQVLVAPAPGRAGRLPFWHGDTVGRPLEFGSAVGQYIRRLRSMPTSEAHASLVASGLDDRAAKNALSYLEEQAVEGGAVPDDRTVVVERFRDEIGDWRLVVHSVFGGRVNTPWAMILAARLRDQLDIDVQVMPSDDGIVLRLPDLGDDAVPDLQEQLVIEPEEVDRLATEAVWGSALFAARFRECSARALLLPRRRPDRRTPLWQQRQRASQLLGVAANHPTFPIVLETMRECLQDVFDVPGLVNLQKQLATGHVRVVDTQTPRPSPFARSLLFSYVGAFLYEGDAPLAERRAAALTVDTGLLAELLGQAELRELLDADAIAAVEARVQWLTPERQLRDLEAVADALRVLGPLTDDDIVRRGGDPAWAASLATQRRAAKVRLPGGERWAAVEDLGRLRDAVGVPVPPGAAGAMLAPVADPVGDLVSRFARTHGPFETAAAAAELGMGPAVVEAALERLAGTGRVVRGAFRPEGTGIEWCDADVLRQIRRASLALVQQSIEPVPAERLATFLPEWQSLTRPHRGVDGLLQTIEQLAGFAAPASEWEASIFPSRVVDYRPAMLDELTGAGEVLWYGAGPLAATGGWVGFVPIEQAAALLPDASLMVDATDAHKAVRALFDGGAALLRRSIDGRLEELGFSTDAIEDALWDLVWSGELTNDTYASVRQHAIGQKPRVVNRLGRRRNDSRIAGRLSPPPGRWTSLPTERGNPTARAHARAQLALNRHGVVTRGITAVEGGAGGFAALYRVLSAMEEAGKARRGYFVESLGAAQFATGNAVDQLRGPSSQAPRSSTVLAATDPANPFGAALPWPATASELGHHPGRKAGATVVIDADGLVMFIERGGRSLLAWVDPSSDRASAATSAVVAAVRAGRRPDLHVERINGDAVHQTPWAAALSESGFAVTPRGLRVRRAR